MAQSGYTPILLYASGTTGNTPSASNLTSSSSGSELALNYYDGKLFYKDNTGTVQVIASKASNSGNFSSVAITGGSINGTTIGSSTASTGAFTTLSASSTVSGTGFSTYLASPPAIGGTTAASGSFTTLSGSTSTTTPIVQSSGSLLLNTNGTTTAVTIDTSQNLGLGVTPSAWVSAYKGFDIGGTVSNISSNTSIFNFLSNAYINGSSTWIYKTSDYAARYQQYSGGHYWLTATSGTAGGTISWVAPMTLTNDSRLYVNCTSALSVDNANISVQSTTGYPALSVLGNTGGFWAMKVGTIDTAGTRYIIGICNNSGATLGGITTNGSVITYGGTSDYRLKDNVQPMVNALDTVSKLKPVTFTWKSNGSASNGFIAHELQAILPEAVAGEKDALEADGSIKSQMVDPSKIVATLVAAIQELSAKVTALEAKVGI